MIKILQLSAIKSAILLLIALVLASSPILAATGSSATDSSVNNQIEKPELSVVERMRAITPLNYKKWSIRSGCINSSRIKRIKFLDDSTALVSLMGKKTAVLKLASRGPGIKKRGFSYASEGQRLCTRHTRFSVLGGTYACKVASIDPYIGLEDPPELQEYD